MNIFISSTILDLIDLRAEIFHHLTQYGFSVRMSEIDVSDFEIFSEKSAIETCLENLRRSDFVIFILDKRYGSIVEKPGFPNISVTHLEYIEAKANQKPILFYIRDKTYSEYKIFKLNPNLYKYNWIAENEVGIFRLIEFHSDNSNKEDNNWIIPFQNSVDIKFSIEKKLKIPYLKNNLAKKIAEGEIPILNAKMITTIQNDNVVLTSEFTNTSNYTIFLKNFGYKNELDPIDNELIPPKEKKQISQIWSKPQIGQNPSSTIIVEYSTYEGILIKLEYRTIAKYNGLSGIVYGIELISRKIKLDKPIKMDLDD
ncbi:DUF4062 domain-containing protein [Leptospira levettii]|uniref:DUF4062 domain-containing protein n=1 Tax=Leptospira levettii TaxID=2023178 RepID=UPI00223CA3E8|nr:DUF4062 domain-containing protein [Leptospira levettii]MCW7509761.1 DUF4062 domain-containing protein [Leptospira levettii]MCW7520848.1 DUF4062 domain-containing protein [Leptospira levettii]